MDRLLLEWQLYIHYMLNTTTGFLLTFSIVFFRKKRGGVYNTLEFVSNTNTMGFPDEFELELVKN